MDKRIAARRTLSDRFGTGQGPQSSGSFSALTRHCPATSVEAKRRTRSRAAGWRGVIRTVRGDVVACTQELVRPRVRITTNWRGRAHEEQPPCSHSVKDSRIASGPVGAPVLPIPVQDLEVTRRKHAMARLLTHKD